MQRKLEKVNERALRYVYKDKHKSYNKLLERAGQVTLENRRIQDILIAVNNCLINLIRDLTQTQLLVQ